MRFVSARSLHLVASCLVYLLFIAARSGAAEPAVQILSPKEGSRITQQQNSVLISGKVASQVRGLPMSISCSSSTFPEARRNTPESTLAISANFRICPAPADSAGQITIGGFGLGGPPLRNLRNSILAAEVGAPGACWSSLIRKPLKSACSRSVKALVWSSLSRLISTRCAACWIRF